MHYLFIKIKISHDSIRDALYCCVLSGQCMLQLTTDIENITVTCSKYVDFNGEELKMAASGLCGVVDVTDANSL